MGSRILAWDYLGSTNGRTEYFNIGKEYLDQFQNVSSEGEGKRKVSLTYLRWNTECIEVQPEDLIGIIDGKKGSGGTSPSRVIHWMQENLPRTDGGIELWLITDGEINSSELAKCSKLNQSMKYSLVKFIIINPHYVNMSVGVSFMSDSTVEIYLNERKFKSINTWTPFDYDSIHADNFEAHWTELANFIQAKFMGTNRDALEETQKLNSLRLRLLNSLRQITNKETQMTRFTSKKKEDLFRDFKECEFYQNLTRAELKTKRDQIDGLISYLVSYIHSTHKSWNFNSLQMDFKTGRIPIAIQPHEQEPSIENLENVEECTFYDCISLEDANSRPVLILPITDLISKYWENSNYANFRRIVDCPFFAVIETYIGHVISVDSFQAIREHSETSGTPLVNPMTNQPIFGGLIFSNSAEADRWNDYVLAHTFFRGKKVTPDLSIWYFQIWKECKNRGNWIGPEVVEMLRAYAFRRLETASLRIGFSSLPLDPKERVPVPVACFYSTEGSAELFGEDPKLFPHERLRMFHSVADSMLEIMKFFGYGVDEDFVRERAATFEMMSQLKKISNVVDKKVKILNRIYKRTQDGRFLTTDMRDAGSVKYLNLLRYGHKDLIPFNVYNNPVDLSAHVAVGYECKVLHPVELCPHTFRPYFALEEESTAGQMIPNYLKILHCLTDVRIELDGRAVKLAPSVQILDQTRILSTCKYYIDLTTHYKRFPTLEELKDWVKEVKGFGNGIPGGESKIVLFQPDLEDLIEGTFKLYQGMNVSVEEFLSKALGSRSVEARVTMENRMDVPEIPKFVAKSRELLKC